MSRPVRGGTVYVLGAGPGDPELLTVRARRVLEAAATVVYADSLVDPRLLELVPGEAVVRGTSGMTLEPIVDLLVAAARRGEVVARVHSGDPCIYGAIAEQLARLDAAGVPWEVVPGVPSPMAAAAALGCELTVPGIAQAVVVCRVEGRTPMPAGQDLRALARPGVSLCILLSAAYAAEVTAALRDGGVEDSTPAVIAERVSWPDERVSWGTVGDLAARLRELGIRRQALLLVGPAFRPASARLRSALYSPEHAHVFRPAGAPGDSGAAHGGIAVYALTAAGAAVGARAAAALDGARLHLPARLAGAVPGAFAEPGGARGVVARLVATHSAVVLVMATGAAVRLVAPHLADKLRDPAVVAIDDGGRWVVPLAGAHARGGNRLALEVAAALGAEAVVTTASDRREWPAPEDVAATRGWRVEEPRRLAAVTAALLDGDPVGLVQECGEPWEAAGAWPPGLRRHPDLHALRAAAPRAAIVITDRPLRADPGWLVLRPPTAVLGVGCEAGVEDAELIAAVDAALAEAGLSPLSVAAVGTLDRKCEEPALRRLCTARGWELRGHPAAVLAEVEVPTPSAVVAAAVGTPSVSEAAALLGSPGARLRQAKRVRGRVTVAVGVAD
ncbi:MAG: precorrin-4 C(11)-methyltransferase [Chloroflexi bacterium]|nr:MAG: precorrin-4 C(11)-methyltransferase [Chloroflexota bacterium]